MRPADAGDHGETRRIWTYLEHLVVRYRWFRWFQLGDLVLVESSLLRFVVVLWEVVMNGVDSRL